jgi:hypothetical protein
VNEREERAREAALLNEFVRVERTESRVRIRVREIRWKGPHTPVSTWAIAQDLPGTATEAEADAAAASILHDSRYFLTCHECGKRNPLGWMHNGRICQGCAEANHGVVH